MKILYFSVQILLLYTSYVNSFTTQPVIGTLSGNFDHDIAKEIKMEGKKCFIFVDPLDDFGQTSTVRERCGELGIDVVTMWSPSVARILLEQAEQQGQLSPVDGEDLSAYIADVIKGTAPRLVNTDELTAEEIALNWLKRHGVNDINNILGVICESDIGLKTSEEFSYILQLSTTNNKCEARRDKYMQQQSLLQAGLSHLKTIRQILTDNWKSAKDFLIKLHTDSPYFDDNTGIPGFSCVIKPCRGAASLGVSRPQSLMEAENVFNNLLGTPGFANGSISDAVLVQEQVGGVEYAIDTVSRNGEHKVVASWKYDKRSINDAPFVYYCTELVCDEESENSNYSNNLMNKMNRNANNDTSNDEKNVHRMQSIYAYACQVLDALEVKWGPAHIEIMWREEEEILVLVEANVGRWHGQDTKTLCNLAYDCNAVSLTLDAYLSNGVEEEATPVHESMAQPTPVHESVVQPTDTMSTGPSSVEAYQHRLSAYHRWTAVPPTPYRRTRCAGRIVHLISHVEGVLSEPPHHVDHILASDDSQHNGDDNCNTSESQMDNNSNRKENLEYDKHVFKSLFRWASKYDADDIGQFIPKTIDLHTTAGYALLLHPDKGIVDLDYFNLVELQLDMFSVI